LHRCRRVVVSSRADGALLGSSLPSHGAPGGSCAFCVGLPCRGVGKTHRSALCPDKVMTCANQGWPRQESAEPLSGSRRGRPATAAPCVPIKAVWGPRSSRDWRLPAHGWADRSGWSGCRRWSPTACHLTSCSCLPHSLAPCASTPDALGWPQQTLHMDVRGCTARRGGCPPSPPAMSSFPPP
jgi:hypothetical protein